MQPKSSRLTRAVRPHRVVAEMRVAVDDAVAIERHVPGAEHVDGERVALLLPRALASLSSGSPSSQVMVSSRVGRQLGHDLRHVHVRLVAQHVRGRARMCRGLAPVVELLAQAGRRSRRGSRRCGSRGRSAGRSRITSLSWPRSASTADCHVGILQLAGDVACRPAASRDAPGRARRRPRPPARSWRTCSASPGPSSLAMRRRTKGQPIGRRVGLQLGQLARRIRPAARRGWWTGAAPPSSAAPSGRRALRLRSLACCARSSLACRDSAGPATRAAMPPTGAPDPGVAADPAAEAVLALEDRRSRVAHRLVEQAVSALELVDRSRAMTPRPLSQKAGSEASRPNGASSSLCRIVPPARSMSRYFALEARHGLTGRRHRASSPGNRRTHRHRRRTANG